MRTILINQLENEAKLNKRIILLTGDLGYGALDAYRSKFPEQFINLGVAEQNMTGIAAGLAIEGFIPIIYSIVPFVTMRNFEQIRNDIIYQKLKVIIVGIGTGFMYGPYGRTHHGIDDISIIRSLPDINIYSPSTESDVHMSLSESLKNISASYIRLGRKINPDYITNKNFISPIKNTESKILVLTTGNILEEALIAHQKTENKYTFDIYTVTRLKPINNKAIIKLINKYKSIITYEEHSKIGGLYTIMSEIITKNNLSVKLHPIAIKDEITKHVGNTSYMRTKHGISHKNLIKTIETITSRDN